jgi:hypothetical protein
MQLSIAHIDCDDFVILLSNRQEIAPAFLAYTPSMEINDNAHYKTTSPKITGI